MTTADDLLEKELFLSALDLPQEDRGAFLQSHCGDNAELQRRIEALLAMESDAPPEFLRGAATEQAVWLQPGMALGGFEIVRVVGEGGMGTVYEARQRSPQRSVALKVVRQGRATPATVGRLRLEAEVLARLQHPGIAQVFEAGSARLPESQVDLPFFSMELVQGRPLLAFVEERELDRGARLELIARLCDAVHHAHQRGIIHRDLKSENVLVVEEESSTLGGADPSRVIGQPKVLDFGVARMIGSEAERTLETRAGDLIGTLSYMSPEQVSGDARDADVRSDVYALGVLLYRVLSGRFPISLEGLSVAQAVERIRLSVPPRLPTYAPSLKGDLEILVARTLEKDPERRLQSAADLASDLRRHLRREPIRARADSGLYVLWRTLRRYWALASSVAAVLLALVAVTTVSSIHSKRNLLLSERLADQLQVSNVERGRHHIELGDPDQAEALLWPEYLKSPESRYARWSLWELYSRSPCLGSWRTHTNYVSQIVFHPSGDTIFSCGWDGDLYRIQDGMAEVVLDLGMIARSLDFSPAGDLLAIATDDGRVGVYEYPSLILLRQLDASEGFAWSTRFHTNERLFTGGVNGGLRLWEPRSGTLLSELEGHGGTVQCIRFSSDGTQMATGGSDPYLLLWPELEVGPPLRIETDHAPLEALAFSADGRLLASGGRDKVARLFELPSTRQVGELATANGFVEDLSFHPLQPEILVTGGWWSTLLWNVETLEVVRRIGFGSPGLTFHEPTGRLVAHSGRTLRLLDESSGGVESLGGHSGRATCEASPTGSLLATADERGLVQLWDLKTASRLRSLRVDDARVRSLSFSADGRRLAVGCESETARVFDLTTDSELLRLEDHVEISASSVCLSPDGRYIAHTADITQVRVLEVDSGETIVELKVDSVQALGVAFHPDGTRFATTSREEDVVRIWDLEGELLQEFATGNTPWVPAFSPDGSRLAVSNWTKSIFVYDLERGVLEAELIDHRAVVWDVAFHPTNPSFLASASDDGTIKLWDIDESRRLATLEDYGEWDAFAVSFAGDGEVLVTAGRGAATLRSLSYFDYHIAANLEFQLSLRASEQLDELAVGQASAWAAEVLARPWPPVHW